MKAHVAVITEMLMYGQQSIKIGLCAAISNIMNFGLIFSIKMTLSFTAGII